MLLFDGDQIMTTFYLVRHGQSKGNKHYQETGHPIVGAGPSGVEPLSKVLETSILPLNYGPNRGIISD